MLSFCVPKGRLNSVNSVTETSPRPLAVRGKKNQNNVSRLCCTNKVSVSEQVNPLLLRSPLPALSGRPSALPVATLAVVCGSAGWVSPSGTLWLHPSKSKVQLAYFLFIFHIIEWVFGLAINIWRDKWILFKQRTHAPRMSNTAQRMFKLI